ncbi:hypothetical protein PFISCL1PPCAC_4336, partial [Pristionchus fissidentatus]
QTYSIMFKIGAVNDLLSVFCDYITMQRLLIIPGNLIYLSSGPCSRISARFCFLMFCLQFSTLVYSLYMMLACFAYRLWILRRPAPKIRNLLIIMGLLYIPPAVVGLAAIPPACSAFCTIYYVEPYKRYLTNN